MISRIIRKKYKIHTEPLLEPVTLAEAKSFLKVDTTDEDTLITSLITVARKSCEDYTQTSLLTQKWDMQSDRFLYHTYLAKYPLQAIDSVKVYDTANNEYTIDSDNYRLDLIANRIVFNGEFSLSYCLRGTAAMKVTYTTGYGSLASDVPEPIKQAILNMIGVLYECRGTCEERPFICKALLNPYRDIAHLGA